MSLLYHLPESTSFSRLLKRMMFVLGLMSLLAMLVLALKSWLDEEREFSSSLIGLANFAAAGSEGIFDSIGSGLQPLGNLLATMDVLNQPETARNILQNFQATHPKIGAISLIKPDGKIIFSTAVTAGEKLPDMSKDQAYINELQEAINCQCLYSIGRTEYGAIINQWRIKIRRGVLNESGEVQYIIHVAIPVDTKNPLWLDFNLQEQYSVGLLRDDGYQQARWPVPNAQKVYATPMQGPLVQTLQAAPDSKSGFYRGMVGADGIERLGAYVRLPRMGLTAYVSVPTSLIWSRWLDHNAPLFSSFIFYLGILIAIGYTVSRRERVHSQELMALSRKDPLTSLPNRSAAEEILKHELARSRRSRQKVALMFLDLDHFKDINDTYGHASGDVLLKEVSQRLVTELREEDVLTRLGGDEFFAILPDVNPDTIETVASRIIKAFAQPYQLESQSVTITTSVGISIFPDDGHDPVSLLKHADAAMYEAKRKGRNRYAFYTESLGQENRNRIQLQNDLKRALKNHEFSLYYQPIIDLVNNRIVGAEALLRWMDPALGLRYPEEFISHAEQSGLIFPIGEWVLNQATSQLAIWTQQGFALKLAVNLSTRQFQDPALSEIIQQVLNNKIIDPSQLTFEITETATMHDPEASIKIIHTLKNLGVSIAIDDFGTGYSSLSYLKRIPADIVKIDKSFIDGVAENSEDGAIVRAIIALAISMEQTCLAEGIETSAQLQTISAMGITRGQGFWLGKPVAAEDFERVLKIDSAEFSLCET